MIEFDKELSNNPAHLVLVVDDLTATMSCSIVAKKQGIKVAHLVAGIRSFDLSMPKEINRMISDGLSDYLFTASVSANRNLNQTGTQEKQVYHVGNILIDNIRYNCKRFIKPIWVDTLNLKKNNYLLLTLNRRVLLNNKTVLKGLLETLISEAKGHTIIAPVHTYVKEAILATGISAPNLHILPSQGYLSFGYLMNQAKAVITDSGNIAEETTFLGILCITLNDYAEHPETWRVGTNELVGENPQLLAKALHQLINEKWKSGELPERWDGRTAERIVQILLSDK